MSDVNVGDHEHDRVVGDPAKPMIKSSIGVLAQAKLQLGQSTKRIWQKKLNHENTFNEGVGNRSSWKNIGLGARFSRSLSRFSVKNVNTINRMRLVYRFQSCVRKVITNLRNEERRTKNETMAAETLKKMAARVPKVHHLILPSSNFRLGWDILVVLLVFFNAIELPLRLCFEIQPDLSLEVFLFIIDLIFFTDIILNFFTTYEMENVYAIGKDVMYEHKHEKVALRYLHGMFLIDLVSTVPFELLFQLFSGESESQGQLAVLGAIKSIRLFRLRRVLRSLDRFQSISITVRICRLMFGFFLTSHWTACAFHLLGIAQENAGSRSWLSAFGLLEVNTISRYTSSLYWAVTTMSSVGFGDIHPTTDWELLFSIVLVMFGAIVYATIFGNVAHIVASMNIKEQTYSKRMGYIGAYLNDLKLPDPIKNSVIRYYDYEWNRKGSFTHSALKELPPSMQEQVSSFVNEELFNTSMVFHHMPQAFKNQLASKLKPTAFLENDVILEKGNSGQRIFFIRKGTVIVRNASNKTLCILQRGSVFGEVALFNDGHRTCSLIALTNCDLYYVKKKHVRQLFQSFPEMEVILRALAQARSSHDRQPYDDKELNTSVIESHLEKKKILQKVVAAFRFVRI